MSLAASEILFCFLIVQKMQAVMPPFFEYEMYQHTETSSFLSREGFIEGTRIFVENGT